MTVSQISSRRPSRLLSAGSWLVALVIVLVPAVSGCDDSAAHEAAPASAAATTPAAVEVPDVVGMKGDAAADALKKAGLSKSPSYTDADGEESVWAPGNWSVTAQDPAAGERVPADQAITLTVNHDSADAAASASAAAAASASAAAEASASAAAEASASAAAAAAEQAAQEEPAQEEPAQPEAPAQEPQSEPEAPADAYYANCTEAKAAGAAPLYRGDPGYRAKLDGDHDGVACEK
ncbi:excalibur calcium-binding domain-containing protein [Actinomyces israelii]|uniref:Excalibur calcium-binding domain-containing protein n=1 Tax=Actinomyces israelii TaxID=1659 RepID=A0ABT4I9D2_9ACTO|nr:excalibur calcium-binding domain-containing protein [Actinomyces israelii]MCZ0858358.1 excalibur calcium-binding domain-containing protein [Actinomyces israelii]